MLAFDECILGDRALHERFIATTEILARLVSSAPRAVGPTQLQDATDRSPREVSSLCAALERAGLVCRQDDGKWTLSGEACEVTLEDVYRCVLHERDAGTVPARDISRRCASDDLNLLVMQAMIAVNQSVLHHLRQFSLDRLKISSAGTFPVPRGRSREGAGGSRFEFAISGREASYGSPVQVPA